MGSYAELYEASKADPEGFWMKATEAVDWIKPPTRALDDSAAPLYSWFADAQCNTCWNAVDRHVEAGRGDQPAIIHDSPVTDSKTVITYIDLQDRTARLEARPRCGSRSRTAPRRSSAARPRRRRRTARARRRR